MGKIVLSTSPQVEICLPVRRTNPTENVKCCQVSHKSNQHPLDRPPCSGSLPWASARLGSPRRPPVLQRSQHPRRLPACLLGRLPIFSHMAHHLHLHWRKTGHRRNHPSTSCGTIISLAKRKFVPAAVPRPWQRGVFSQGAMTSPYITSSLIGRSITGQKRTPASPASRPDPRAL